MLFGIFHALLGTDVSPLEDYWDYFSDKIDQAYKSGMYKSQFFSEQGGPGNEVLAKDLYDFFHTSMHKAF